MAAAQQAIGVIGGGALGLGAALRLAEGGRRVVVIEREAELGGLAAGFRPGADSAATLEKFYHHIFRTDRTIIRTIKHVGLGERLVWKRPVTASLRDGHVYPMSLGGILRFDAIPLVDRLRFGTMLAALKLTPGERPFAGSTAAGWSRRVAGPRAYAALIEPILEGKFGGRADEITMSWLWSRFHERSLALGYLRGGFQQLYDALGERIQALGGEILLGSAAQRICSRAGAVHVETSAGACEFERVVVTAPQRVFERMAEGLPDGWSERHPGPEFYNAQVLILALDRQLTDSYWISIGDPGYPFLVVVEHTNFMPTTDYGGRHLVYLGNYLPPDHPLLRQNDAELLETFLPAIRRLNPAFQPEWVQQRWLFQAPFAQPIVTEGYLRRLPPLRTPLRGVYLATMAHVYPQDRGQNYSLALGRRVADLLLRDVGAARA
ncbi:MAG TPA: NAD(P)/FAD-dependent oxidoreductase [Dehalococcoidia bacterium]|jgi:protoporphyrinogen oxidase